MSARPFRDEAHRDAALLKWLRREVNRDLRYWRSEPVPRTAPRYLDLVADCKAKLGMISWAEHWQDVRTEKYVRENYFADRPDVREAMTGKAEMIMHAVRRIAAAYSGRDGWRQEWDVR